MVCHNVTFILMNLCQIDKFFNGYVALWHSSRAWCTWFTLLKGCATLILANYHWLWQTQTSLRNMSHCNIPHKFYVGSWYFINSNHGWTWFMLCHVMVIILVSLCWLQHSSSVIMHSNTLQGLCCIKHSFMVMAHCHIQFFMFLIIYVVMQHSLRVINVSPLISIIGMSQCDIHLDELMSNW